MGEELHKATAPSVPAGADDGAKSAAMDELIRLDVLNALQGDLAVPQNSVNVEVRGCQVTLTGKVHSEFSKACAERDAEATAGVIGVTNAIVVADG